MLGVPENCHPGVLQGIHVRQEALGKHLPVWNEELYLPARLGRPAPEGKKKRWQAKLVKKRLRSHKSSDLIALAIFFFCPRELELPEKAVDELVELMRSRPRSLDIMLEKPRPSQPLRSTLDAVAAYLSRMEDAGAANGYLQVRARKLRFFARQYPDLPTSPEPIRAYLRQFKTNDVPTRQDQWKALSALYKFTSGEYDLPNPMLKVDKPRFRKKSGGEAPVQTHKRRLSYCPGQGAHRGAAAAASVPG